MNSHTRLRTGLLAGSAIGLAAAGGCALSAPPPPISVEQHEWTAPDGSGGVRLLTEHFDLRVTAADPELRKYLGPFMETAFAEYCKLMPPPQEPSDRLAVYLFGTRQEWADFTRVSFPAQAHTYLHIHFGGYVDQPTATAVIHDIGRDHTLSLIAHEGFHQYLAGCFPEPVHPWLNEGLACQWEAFDLEGDRPVFTPRRNFLRRNSLREALATPNGLIRLPELLGMHAGEAVVQAGQPTRAYYAQVWSMVLLLRQGSGGKYADRFAKLLGDAGTKRLRIAIGGYRAATQEAEQLSDGEVIFRHYITEDLDGFMADYEAFARQLVY